MDKRTLFINLLKALQEQKEKDRDFCSASRKVSLLGEGLHYDNSVLINALINAADNLLPEPEEKWVNWFYYDSDFGKENLAIKINNEKYIPKTPEELYDILNGN